MKKPLALIAEDDSTIAQLFSTVLQDAGFDIEVHRNGLTALNRLPQAKPDLILLDVRLPYVQGTDLLRIIREDKRIASTPVFVVTAHWEDTQSPEVIEYADLVLLKPVSTTQLFDFAVRYRPQASEVRTGLSPLTPVVLGDAA